MAGHGDSFMPGLVYSSDDECDGKKSTTKPKKQNLNKNLSKFSKYVRIYSWISNSEKENVHLDSYLVLKIHVLGPCAFGIGTKSAVVRDEMVSLNFSREDVSLIRHLNLEEVLKAMVLSHAATIIIDSIRNVLDRETDVARLETYSGQDDTRADFSLPLDIFKHVDKSELKKQHYKWPFMEFLQHVRLNYNGMNVARRLHEENLKLDKEIESVKTKGNNNFRQKKYTQAITNYTEAIGKHRFNHILYGNRAQAYLNMDRPNEALSDGFRATLLNPEWPKGHYRFAEAFFQLNNLEKAAEVNQKGIDKCPHDSDLKTQKVRITERKSGVTNNHVDDYIKVQAKMDDDVEGRFRKPSKQSNKDMTEIPDLVSDSADDEDSSDSDSEPPAYTGPYERKLSTSSGSRSRTPSTSSTASQTKKPSVPTKKPEPTKSQQPKAPPPKQPPPAKKPQEATPPPRMSPQRTQVDAFSKDELFEIAVRHGTQELLGTNYPGARDHYATAATYLRDFIRKPKNDMVLIFKYAQATAFTHTGLEKDVVNAIKLMEEIPPSAAFPLAYLALGRAYLRQNRFGSALTHLRLGKDTKSSALKPWHYTKWPSSTELIQETEPGKFQVACITEVMRCLYPPRPTAVCRLADCPITYGVNIYRSDPHYTGYVRIMCAQQCVIDFHNDCWRTFKNIHLTTKKGEKDIVNNNEPCPTPDCPSTLYIIIFFAETGGAMRRFETKDLPCIDKEKKINIKTLPVNESKITRRAEKKAIRREKKREARETKQGEATLEVNVGVQIIQDLTNNVEQPTQQVVIENPAPVLELPTLHDYQLRNHKDEEPDLPMKINKVKKEKKKKNKSGRDVSSGQQSTVILPDVQFNDHSRPPRIDDSIFCPPSQDSAPMTPDAHSGLQLDQLDDFQTDHIFPVLDSQHPFSVPESIVSQVEMYNRQVELETTGVVSTPPPSPSINGMLRETSTDVYHSGDDDDCPDGAPAPSPGPGGTYMDYPPPPQLSNYPSFPPPASTHRAKPKSAAQPTIRDTIFNHLAGFLDTSSHGPMLESDPILQREVAGLGAQANQAIAHVGGIGKYLTSSMKFMQTRPGGFICLMRDLKEARELAATMPVDHHATSLRDISNIVTNTTIPPPTLATQPPPPTASKSPPPTLEEPAATKRGLFPSPTKASKVSQPPSDSQPPSGSQPSGSQPSGSQSLASQPSGSQPSSSTTSKLDSLDDLSPAQSSPQKNRNNGNNSPTSTTKSKGMDVSVHREGDYDGDDDEDRFSTCSEDTPRDPPMNDHVDLNLKLKPGHKIASWTGSSAEPKAKLSANQSEPTKSAPPPQTLSSLYAGSIASKIEAEYSQPSTMSEYTSRGADKDSSPEPVKPGNDALLTAVKTSSPAPQSQEPRKTKGTQGEYMNMTQANDRKTNPDLQIDDKYSNATVLNKKKDNIKSKTTSKAADTTIAQAQASLAASVKAADVARVQEVSILKEQYRTEAQDLKGEMSIVRESYEEKLREKDREIQQAKEDRKKLEKDARRQQQDWQEERARMNKDQQKSNNMVEDLNVQLEASRKKAGREREKVESELRAVRDQYREASAARDTLASEAAAHRTNLAASMEAARKVSDLMVVKEDMIVTLSSQRDHEKSRAKQAEMKLLHLQREVGMAWLERSLQQADAQVVQLTEMLPRVPATRQLLYRDTLLQWQQTRDNLRQVIQTTKSEYQQQITLVQEGLQMASLPILSIPRPPTPPPHTVQSLTESAPMRPPAIPSTLPDRLSDSSGSPRAQVSPHSTVPGTPASAQGGVSKSNSTMNKLLDTLLRTFPHYNKSEIKDFISAVRRDNGGTLSGLPMDQIVQRAANLILQSDQDKNDNPPPRAAPAGAASGSASAAAGGSEAAHAHTDSEEDKCSICLDSMLQGKVQTLNCTHQFHTNCISDWLKRNSICPNCRNYAILPEDYPPLG